MSNMDSKNWAVLGTAAAAVAAGIYILWGPTLTSKRKKRGDTCPGLSNLGNTCFLNAILQSWATCTSLVQWMGDFVDKRITERYTQYLAFSILRVLKVLNNDGLEECYTYNPGEVVDALRNRRWIITSDEQDAHELFHVLTETLNEETRRFPGVVPLFDLDTLKQSSACSQPDSTAISRHRLPLCYLPPRGNSDHPFKGLLASKLQCKVCGYKCPIRYDSFDSLSLSIPSNSWGPLGLDQLLRHYVSCETVQDVECEGCAKIRNKTCDSTSCPKPKATYFKKLTIGKLPQCLCIHIQRTVWLEDGMPMKRYEHIRFPEILSMDNYVYHKQATLSILDNRGGLLYGGKSKQMSSKRIQSSTQPIQKTVCNFPVQLFNKSTEPKESCTKDENNMERSVPVAKLQHEDPNEVGDCETIDANTTNANKTKENLSHGNGDGNVRNRDLFDDVQQLKDSRNKHISEADGTSAETHRYCQDNGRMDKAVSSYQKPKHLDNEILVNETPNQTKVEDISKTVVPLQEQSTMQKVTHLDNLNGCVSQKFEHSQLKSETDFTKQISRQESIYRLVSVVSHLGDVFSGHFVTYRRAPARVLGEFNEKWLCASDELITQVTFEEVINSSAYMLFYEKL